MNLEKFKSLSFKEKLNWIWEYYAVTIVVVIVAVVVCAFLVASMLGVREGQRVDLSVLILDDRMNQESAEGLRSILEENVPGNIEISFYSKSNSEQFQAFVVRTAVDGSDLVIAPQKEMSELAQNEYVADDYVMLDESSFYAKVLDLGTEYSQYEEVCLGVAKRGSNPNNSKIIWERYKQDE